MSILDLLSTVPAWAALLVLVGAPLFAYSLGIAVGRARAEQHLDKIEARIKTEVVRARNDVLNSVWKYRHVS